MDTSALVAIFLEEDGHHAIADVIDFADEALVSVFTRVELVSVLCGGRFRAEPAKVAGFIDDLHLVHVPISEAQMRGAIRALLNFGKGRHPAKLNLGDCFCYALAQDLGAQLLFKGDDFALTDVLPAWLPDPNPK